jgi:4-hydroxy-tetrahydrodipicolinate synthase
MTALVTPFRGGPVDYPTLDRLVDRQIEGGTNWVVPCGTTGESPTLSHEEHDKVIEAVVARVAGRCGVMAGTGSNSTAEAIRLTRHARTAGVDAAMLVAPYYNRPSPEGLYRHFAAVADAVDLPIVLYNVPARTGVEIPNGVVVRLRKAYPHIAAIKHATGRVSGVTELLGECDIAVLSGDDSLTWPLMALGAVGVVSVLGNLLPELLQSLVEAALAGDARSALEHHRRVHDLAEGIGSFGPNPLPIKTAMALSGLIEEEFRLPLCPLPPEGRAGIDKVLRRAMVLEPAG